MNNSLQKNSFFYSLIALFGEVAKITYHVQLFAAYSPEQSALLGTALSIAYLSAHIAGLEGGIAIMGSASDLGTFHNRSYVQARTIWQLLIIPQLLLHLIGATLVCLATHTFFNFGCTLSLFTGLLALTEGLRSALRPLAYATTPQLILPLLELCAAALVTAHFLVSHPTPEQALIFFVGAATIPLLAFVFSLSRFTHKDQKQKMLPSFISHLKTSLTLVIAHLPKNSISENLFVPILFTSAGAQTTQTVKLIGALVRSVKTCITSLFSHPINKAFINADKKDRHLLIKIEHHIKATMALLTILAAIGISAAPFFMSSLLTLLGASFVIMMLVEYAWTAYETLFVLTKHQKNLMVIKGCEFAAALPFLSILTSHPAIALSCIAFVKLSSLFVAKMVLNAENNA